MKALKIFGIAIISQVAAFLGAVVSHFGGTIFGFVEWEEKASKSAVAAGLPIVLIIVGVCFGASKATLKKCAIGSLAASVIPLFVCAGIYMFLESGFPLTAESLFLLRNIIWMSVYIFTLVVVSVTISFGMLLLK